MKKILYATGLALLSVACSVESQVDKDPAKAAEEFVANFKKGDYKAIYEDASTEMKFYVEEDVFIDVHKAQEKVFGKITKVSQQGTPSSSPYKTGYTTHYDYTVENERGEPFTLSVDFLKGHMIKTTFEELNEWLPESDFAKSLVDPVRAMIQANDTDKLFEAMGEAYPKAQIQSLVDRINKETDGVPSRYHSFYVNFTSDNEPFVNFGYAYEGRGYLDYRFSAIDQKYNLVGINFDPDTSVSLPE